MSNDRNRRDPFINQQRPETGQLYPRSRQPRRPNASPFPPVGRPAVPGEDFGYQADPPETAGWDFRTPAGPPGEPGRDFGVPADPREAAGVPTDPHGAADGGSHVRADAADGGFDVPADAADGGFRVRADARDAADGDFRAAPGRARSAGDGRDVAAGRRPAPDGPTAAPRKRSRSPWVVGGFLLIVVLGLAAVPVITLGGARPVMNALGFDQKSKKAVDGRMNTPIADGTFEFTVTSARCGLDQVGEGKTVQFAQGQFCLIDVTVKNVGSSPVLFDAISQTAYDATGNQYSADSTAEVAANKGQPAFLQQIDPGATVRGRLAFDISTRETLIAVVLHESIFSNGVRIPLR